MVLKIVYILVSIIVSVTMSDKILLLSDKNYDSTISSKNNTLVHFTVVEGCPLCDEMQAAFKDTFRKNKELKMPLTFAKVDVTKNPNVVSKNSVTNVPSMRLVSNGKSVVYNGVANSTDLFNWLRKKLLSPVLSFDSLSIVEDYIKRNENVLIFFGQTTSKFFEIYKTLSEDITNIEFVQCETQECKTQFKIHSTDRVILYKNFGKNQILLDSKNKNEEDFKREIKMKFQSELLRFSSKVSTDIFSEGYPALILYRDEKADKDKKLEGEMLKLAKQLRGKMMVVLSDIVNDVEKDFANFLGITAEDLPTVRIFDAREMLKKYKYTGEINFEKLYQFYQEWKNEKIHPYLKSEKVPEKQGTLHKIVSDKFIDVVFEKDKDVLVLFYRSNEEKIKEILEVFENFAQIVRNNNNLVVGTIDLNKNEIPLVEVERTPSAMLFAAGQKHSHYDYNEKQFTVSDLRTFVKKYAKHRVTFDKIDL